MSRQRRPRHAVLVVVGVDGEEAVVLTGVRRRGEGDGGVPRVGAVRGTSPATVIIPHHFHQYSAGPTYVTH